MIIKKKKPEKKIDNPGTGVSLWTDNTNGLLNEVSTMVKGRVKTKEEVNWNCSAKIINNVTGEILTQSISPRYADWSYDDYASTFNTDDPIRFLTPMGALEPKDYQQQPGELAELKLDGHRATIHITPFGNRAFSRTVSKKTGWYSENSDQIPHIRDLPLHEFYGTVLDGELDYGGDSMDVQSVLGALPANAIQYQFKHGFLPYVVFDILYFNGVNIQAMPLWKRRIFAAIVVSHINSILNFDLVKLSTVYLTTPDARTLSDLSFEYCNQDGEVEPEVLELLDSNMVSVGDFKQLFVSFLDQGREGLMIKDMYARYEQRKCKAMLKMKGKETHDIIFLGLSEPTKEYEGKRIEEGTLHEWEYWYLEETKTTRFVAPGTPENMELWMDAGFEPVSKPFAKGWCGGIIGGIYRPISSEGLWEVMDETYGPDIDQAWDEGLLRRIGDEVYHLEEVTTVKGLTEEIMIDLAANSYDYMHDRVLEVTSNGFIDRDIGSLRHPRFKQWRDDKTPDQCIWSSYLGEEDE